MDIDRIPAGTTVFIDANIFIYHFAGVSQECTALLHRIRSGEITATVTDIVVAEVIHRRMIAEAVDKGLATIKNVVRKLKENPAQVISLSQYSQDVENILALPITIASISSKDIVTSKSNRIRYGLLSNDSLNLACMERLGITNIATHDDDFARILGLAIWKPNDISS